MNIPAAAAQVETTEFGSATARRARNVRPIRCPLGATRPPKLTSAFCAGLRTSRRAPSRWPSLTLLFARARLSFQLRL